MVTPVGIGGEAAYQALCQGKNGIVRLPSWADEYPAQVRANSKSIHLVLISRFFASARVWLILTQKKMD
jgi:hypothetical protein